MTQQEESLRYLDECIAYLDSLSDEEINKLSEEAEKYMSQPIKPSEFSDFEILPGFKPNIEVD